jgi:arginine utilization protein RocB
MKWQKKNELEQLMKNLVGIKSISSTPGEVEIAEFIYEQLKSLRYYRENPNHLTKVEILGPENPKRFSIIALMKKSTLGKTLLGVGHFDTVGIDDALTAKEIFINPDEYTKQIGKFDLDSDSREDLESGEYLFGRGVMDMKAGIALLMHCLEYYGDGDSFNGNLLFSFVGDEEMNSEGVLAVIPEITKILERENLRAIACLDTEPDFKAYPNDDNKYMYFGSAGKLLAGFFVFGKETHVGESLSGFNPHLIIANIIKRMELNINLTEKIGKDVTLPPTGLKLEDHKRLYNVQTPLSAHIYYNLQTFKDSPKVYMGKLIEIAKEAVRESCRHVLQRTQQFKKNTNFKIVPLKLSPRVYTYAEFYDEVKRERNNVDQLLDDEIKRLEGMSLDQRDLTVALISKLQELSSNKVPKVIVFFAPPYYPHVSLNTNKPSHKAVAGAAAEAIRFAKEKFNLNIIQSNYFQGLCDLSYFALEDARDVLCYLKPNMPTFGKAYREKAYTLPLSAMETINVPVINFGPHGKDPHKSTERILVDYSFNIVPTILKELIQNLFL